MLLLGSILLNNVWSSGAGPQPASLWDLIGQSKEPCDTPDRQLLRQLPTNAQSGAIFLVMAPSSALMFAFGRYCDVSSRTAYYAAAWVGALGSLATFILYYPVCNEFEPIVNFYLGMVLAPAMLALMSVSGFRST